MTNKPELVVLVWRGGRYEKVPQVGIDIIRQLLETRGEEEGLPALYAEDDKGLVICWPKPSSRNEVTIVRGGSPYVTDKNHLAMLHSIKGVE